MSERTAAVAGGAYRARRSDWRSAAVVGAHLVVVLAPVYLAAVLAPGVVTIACWLWFGLLAHGLTNLMHEAAHLLVFRSRRANEALGTWVLAPLFLTDFHRYRERHWRHHRCLGEDDDSKDAYLVEVRGWRFLRLVAGCLVLRNALALLAKGTDEGAARHHERSFRLLPLVVFQAAFAGSVGAAALASVGGDLRGALLRAAVAYGFVYLYGTASLTVLVAGLRAICEHQLGEGGGAAAGRAALRNLRSTPLSRLVFGCYGFAEHASHHREPAIPYYRLPAYTAELSETDPAMRPTLGYLAVLRGCVGVGELRTGDPPPEQAIP